MSLQKFFEEFICDADMLVEVFDANMRKIVFRDRWLNIKSLDKEYRGNRYRVICCTPLTFTEIGENGLSLTIDLKR